MIGMAGILGSLDRWIATAVSQIRNRYLYNTTIFWMSEVICGAIFETDKASYDAHRNHH